MNKAANIMEICSILKIPYLSSMYRMSSIEVDALYAAVKRNVDVINQK